MGRPPGRLPRLLRRRLRLPGDRGRGGRPRQRPLAAAVQPGSTFEVVDHGIALLRAAALGQELPPDPPPAAPGPPDDDQPPPAATDLPAELAPLTGTYAAYNPWNPHVRVVPAAGGTLALEWPDGGIEPLVPLPDAGFRVGEDPDTPERATFGAEVDGRPARVVVSGWPFDGSTERRPLEKRTAGRYRPV